jgi:hypothetical protein
MSLVPISTVSGAVTDQDQTTVPVILKAIYFAPGSAATTLVLKDATTTLCTFVAVANASPEWIPLNDGLVFGTKLTVTTTGASMGAVFFK